MPKEETLKMNSISLYPEIELPKWMTSKENAVISLDDL